MFAQPERTEETARRDRHAPIAKGLVEGEIRKLESFIRVISPDEAIGCASFRRE
jgi:hypothetical protein